MTDLDNPAAEELQHALDIKRYQLEVKKLAFERYKFKKEDRSLPKRLGWIVAAVASSVTVLISVATLFLQNHRASLERALAEQKAEREYKLQVAGLIASTRDQLFSSEPEKQAIAIQTLRSTVPHQVYNRIFGQAAEQLASYDRGNIYRAAQSIDFRWPEDSPKPFGQLPEFTRSVPEQTRTVEGKTVHTFCPLLNSKTTAEKISADEYKFSVSILPEQGGRSAIDWVVFTPVHPAFITDYPNRPGVKFLYWFAANPGLNAKFTYIGKYPIDKLRITVYRGPDFPKCETELSLARDLGW